MLELALPWGMSYMIQQNGYHPLYSYLLRNHPPEIKLNCLDDVKTRHNLKHQPSEVDRLVRKGRSCLDNLPPFFSEHFKSETLLLELGLAAEIPGDIEFVHTSPVATGTRPFILHLESFFSLFLPFEGNPTTIIDDKFELKAPMREFLASNNCVGIYSHLKQTLHEIATYFNCPTIENKLSHIPIGFDDGYQRSPKKPRYNSSPRFLVLCSAHQNPNNFIDRGGIIVLEAWEKLHRLFPDSQLIWRSQRPSPNIIENIKQSNIVNTDALLESVTWIERRLNDRELDHLFAYADFVLLPSLWLHSTTILRALACECIPLVSDIPQLDEYRENGGLHTIEGIRALNWSKKNGINIPNASLVHTPSIVNKLVETVEKLWEDDGISARRRSTSTYREYYNGKARASEFYARLLGLNTKEQITSSKNYFKSNDSLALRNELSKITFEGPQPILLHVSEPLLHHDLDQNVTAEHFRKYHSATVPKFVFKITDRVHAVSYMSWPALSKSKSLEGFSAYHNINSDDYQVHSMDDVPLVIEKVQMNDHDITQKYRQYLKKRNELKIDPKTNISPIDIELITDYGTFNLLRVYHLFVCYEKNKGEFPVVAFIENPLAFSPFLLLRKDLARLYSSRTLNANKSIEL